MTTTYKRPLDPARAFNGTTVPDVQISPDGRQIAYVTTPASKADEQRVSDIWLVAAEGGDSVRLTTSEATDEMPRWSPDGKRIAFLSDRLTRGKSQLYLLNLEGGEAVRLTDFESGVGRPVWSPEGLRIAFFVHDAEADPDATPDRDAATVVDADLKMASLWVLDVPEDAAVLGRGRFPDARRLSPADLHVGGGSLNNGFVWTPDGRAVLAVAARSPKPHDTYMPQMVIFTLDGEVRHLGQFEGLSGTPQFSPDGEMIAFVAAEESFFPALFSLHTIPAAGGDARIVAPGYEGSFYGFDWLADGRRVVAAVEKGQHYDLQTVDVVTGEQAAAFAHTDAHGIVSALSLSAHRTRVAYACADDLSFGDVYVADIGDEARRLTDLSAWLHEYELGEVREISWTSFDGLEIEGLLILPVGYEAGRRYPMLVHIHGGPQIAWTRRPYAGWNGWGQFLAQREHGYVTFLPNPRGSSGRGVEFLCSIVACYGEPDIQDILTGVDYLVDEGIADPDRLVVGGWSGGGYLTNRMIVTTGRFKAAVTGAGIANWVSFQGTSDARSVFDRYISTVTEDPETHWRLSPIRTIKQATTPTMIVYGAVDPRVPPSQGHELYEGLKARGVETQLVLYPREGHPILEHNHQIDLIRRITQWFNTHLGR